MNRPAWLLAGALAFHPGWGGIPDIGIPLPYAPSGWGGHYGNFNSYFYGVPLRSGYETTPFSDSGQTICSRGRVEDAPGGATFWHDGETAYGPKYAGTRCITLP